VAAVLLAIPVLIWLLHKSKTQQTEWESSSPGAKSPDAVIEKFHLISTVQGEKHWELYSTSAQLFQTQKQAYADNIYAQYFKKNKLVSTLTADKAVINTETNDTQVEGHIELITENGSKLETEKLNWDPDTDEIKTDARVHIYKGSDDITAIGMVADTQLNNVRFMRDVRTKVRDTGEVERFHEPKKF
jgi:LPS export ABC transporter protein LptC